MFLASLAWVVLLTMPAPVSTPEVVQDKPASTGRLVEIIGGDDMKYSVTSISAKPGETLRIRLVSKGTLPKIAMAHNVVVLKAGAKQIDFVNAASQARATDFIPPDMKDQVLAATTPCGTRRDRGGRIQSARRRRLVSVRLHVPRPLRRGHARNDCCEVRGGSGFHGPTAYARRARWPRCARWDFSKDSHRGIVGIVSSCPSCVPSVPRSLTA